MTAKLCFEQQQNQRRHQQQDSRIADGQQVQRKDGEQHQQRAQRAGNDGPRCIEFQIDEQRSAHQQQQGNIGVHQPAKQLLAHRGPQHFNPRSGQVQGQLCSVHTGNLAAVQSGQQLRVAGRQQVDQMLIKRLLSSVGVGRVNSRLSGLGVAVAAGNVRAQKCLRVVLHFLVHSLVELLTKLAHRMSRSSVGAGVHRGHVRRLQQKESCRAGTRTGRSYIHDHRNPRTENRSNHGAGRVQQAARRIQLHQQRLGPVGIGLRNGPFEQPLRHRLDRIGKNQLVHKRLLCRYRGTESKDRNQTNQYSKSVHTLNHRLLLPGHFV